MQQQATIRPLAVDMETVLLDTAAQYREDTGTLLGK